MKKILLIAILSLGTAAVAWAEKGDMTKPSVITYGSLDIDDVAQTRIFTGNFVLTRGTLVLKSDKAVLKESPEGDLYVTLTAVPGKAATFRQKRDSGPDAWVEGQAQRIEYDDRNGLVKMFGNAKIKQLDGTKLSDEIDSEFVSYDSRKEVFTARNDASGEDKPGKGRGTMVIAPRRTAAPAASAPAASASAPATAPAPGK
jgi:lipopolysaccharide export system protein LptA